MQIMASMPTLMHDNGRMHNPTRETTTQSGWSPLGRLCLDLNLSIHDRHEVQAALERGENMEQFAQKIIRRGCV